jgi:hypothetical protein
MKAGAISSIKFMKLKRELHLTKWQAVGLLECLWQFVSSNAPQGDIGRHTNDDIASFIEWEGSSEELISALTKCGWIDVSEDHRLLIHDWHDHCPNYIKGGLAKAGLPFLTEAKVLPKVQAKVLPKLPPKLPPKDEAKVQAKLVPTKPNHTIPSQATPSEEAGGGGLSKEFFERHDEYHFIANCEPLSKITIERYAQIKREYPNIKDFKKTLREICLKAKDPEAIIKKPDGWLISNLSYASQRDESAPTAKTEWDKIIKRGCIVC